MYVSITGLKPKGILGFIKFWRLAIPSFRQAQTAKGNLYCSVKRMKGYQCTVTAWESRDVMLAFMKSGTHLKAMKSFHSIATGKTYGYYEQRMISLGFIDTEYAKEGDELTVLWGPSGQLQKEIRATVASFPYYNGEFRNETFDIETIPHPKF